MIRQTDRYMLWAEIDLGALRRNARIIWRQIGGGAVGILAIIKADAYGHGMLPVARALLREGVRFFGVANIDEAVILRRVCPGHVRILVLGPFHENHLNLYRQYRILPTISSFEDLHVLAKRLKGKQTVFPVHVKIDTGMGRLGLWHTEAGMFFKKLRQTQKLFVEGIYTHFSRADEKSRAFTAKQIRIFNDVIMTVRQAGIMPMYLHAANSTALMRFKQAHLNLVRPGIILYGLSPSKSQPLPEGMGPVMSLKGRITLLKSYAAGTGISYGGTYRTRKKTQIAVVPIGYSYGYRIAYSNRAHAIVRGVKCPIVGRVTMDQTLIDVSRVKGVRRWDVVTLIGKDGRHSVTAQDLADLIQSIPYEVVCSLHSRIPRIHK